MSKYNKKCTDCKTNLSKNEAALNIKIYGNTNKQYCLKCLSERLDVTIEDLNEKINEYKAGGCTLFE